MSMLGVTKEIKLNPLDGFRLRKLKVSLVTKRVRSQAASKYFQLAGSFKEENENLEIVTHNER